VPIAEIDEQAMPLTYRDIGLTNVAYPHLPVHYDPEFDTFTYGHAWRGWGDQRLKDMQGGDLLFFYSTLDLLPDKTRWGLYIIGFFMIQSVVNTTKMTPEEIARLPGFENNAHLRYERPKAHLLVKGSAESRLYTRAIPLSDPNDNRRIHPSLRGMLKTAGGRIVEGGPGWYR
jgi:hypothetical protein